MSTVILRKTAKGKWVWDSTILGSEDVALSRLGALKKKNPKTEFRISWVTEHGERMGEPNPEAMVAWISENRFREDAIHG